ncbi:unnamed protein product [Urochloa decumbens]|uniref:F-box domain-containing protein n=1 Tax=Urochloa decumbens TaxID=240449 RepID=A0ABC8WAZ1_9POAL
MEEDGQRRRRRRRTRTAAMPERGCHAGAATSIHDLPNDLLELVLLRVPCPVTLARAASTCRPWRRLISSAGFIRRHRCLHPPPVLGHFYARCGTSFVPAPPPPGPPRATAVDAIRDRVSLRFLPHNYNTCVMELTDSRGGLLALVCNCNASSSVVMCDPLARRFREVCLPAAMPVSSSERFTPCCLGAFLLDAGDEDDTAIIRSLSVSNFRVLCVPLVSEDDDHGRSRLSARAFVFSARESRWVLLSLSTTVVDPCAHRFLGRTAEGSLVWSGASCGTTKVLHLDENTGDFSYFALPAPAKDVRRDVHVYYWRWNLRAVGRDDTGAMRLARIVGGVDLEVLRCVPGGGGGAVTVERAVNLSDLTGIKPWSDRSWHFLEMDDAAVPTGSVVVSTTEKCRWMFTIDVEIMEAVRGRKRDCDARAVLPYELPWPPPIK